MDETGKKAAETEMSSKVIIKNEAKDDETAIISLSSNNETDQEKNQPMDKKVEEIQKRRKLSNLLSQEQPKLEVDYNKLKEGFNIVGEYDDLETELESQNLQIE